MILGSASDLRKFAKANPWLEAGKMPPVIQEIRGRYMETIGLSLNH